MSSTRIRRITGTFAFVVGVVGVIAPRRVTGSGFVTTMCLAADAAERREA